MNSPYPVATVQGTSVALETAEALRFMDGRSSVRSPEQYLGWQAQHVDARQIARVHHPDARIQAVVNHGRWIAHCSECYQGMFTHPEWKIGCCSECGAIFTHIVFPAEIDEITRLLLLRPRRETQNWEPGPGDHLPGVWRLKWENRLHRLPT